MGTKIVARIFEDVGGYYICSEALDYLDARGTAYQSKAEAMRSAYASLVRDYGASRL